MSRQEVRGTVIQINFSNSSWHQRLRTAAASQLLPAASSPLAAAVVSILEHLPAVKRQAGAGQAVSNGSWAPGDALSTDAG